MLGMQAFYSQLMQVGVGEEMAATPTTRAASSPSPRDEDYWQGLVRLTQLSLGEVTALDGDQGWEAWG